MPDDTYRLADDFAPSDADRWRDLVSADLKGRPWTDLVGRTRAGLEIQPLYTAADWDAADASVHARGDRDPALAPSWDVRPEYVHPDPATVNARILRDLSRGTTSVLLRLDPAGREGVAVRSAEDLEAVLADVDLARTPVVLAAGARFVPAAALLAEVRRARGVADDAARGALQADPIGAWCLGGGLPVGLSGLLEDMADLAARTAAASPDVRAVNAAACPFHDAGADEAQELGFTLAEAVAYLRALEERGLDADVAASQIQFCFPVTGELFGEIAKLRAARTLWGRVVEACGGGPVARRMRLHARTSARVATRRDPWVNMLRATTAAFAAMTGGADSITVDPFDATVNVPDDFSRRIARNVQIILQEESHLGHVVDPAGGCWHLERRTADLAERAWSWFQDVERRGGLVAGLREGWIQARIAEVREARARDVARRKAPITGVSEFPVLDVPDVARTRPTPPTGAFPGDMGLAGEDGTMHDPVEALARHADAEPFEALRDAADAHLARTGARPRVFLCSLGSLAQHNARTSWIRNVLAAGGIEATSCGETLDDPASAASALRRSGDRAAIVCASDETYAEKGPEVAAALKAAGAADLLLAGRWGDLEARWREAGVTVALHLGCDVLEILRDLHRTLEVKA